MAQNNGELVFVLHQSQNTTTHDNLTTRISHRAAKAGMKVYVKRIGQFARAVLGDLITDFLQVFFNSLLFGRLANAVQLQKGGDQRVSGADLILEREGRW